MPSGKCRINLLTINIEISSNSNDRFGVKQSAQSHGTTGHSIVHGLCQNLRYNVIFSFFRWSDSRISIEPVREFSYCHYPTSYSTTLPATGIALQFNKPKICMRIDRPVFSLNKQPFFFFDKLAWKKGSDSGYLGKRSGGSSIDFPSHIRKAVCTRVCGFSRTPYDFLRMGVAANDFQSKRRIT